MFLIHLFFVDAPRRDGCPFAVVIVTFLFSVAIPK